MTQPWASLFVKGEAQFETRTWRTKYRGQMAIHSSKKVDKSACKLPEVQALLEKHGYTSETLPTGVIIAVCTLKDCLKVAENHGAWAVLEDGRIVEGDNLIVGDYRVGNFAWEVEDMRELAEFIPAKGQLGLWEFEGEIV